MIHLKSPVQIYKQLGKQPQIQKNKPKSKMKIRKNNRPIMKQNDGDFYLIIYCNLPAHLKLVEEI
jgi:hypothetical protein